MSRYRAPGTPASKYITRPGAARMQAELDHLWRVLRPQVTAAVAAAAAQGDRSENAEYIYGKKQLREIDRRVRHLRKRLEDMVIVDQPPSDPSRVFFGAWVRIEDDTGLVRAEQIENLLPDRVGDPDLGPHAASASADEPRYAGPVSAR